MIAHLNEIEHFKHSEPSFSFPHQPTGLSQTCVGVKVTGDQQVRE